MEKDMLYFCSFCKDRSEEDIAKISCEMEERRENYKRGDYIAYAGDRVKDLVMLVEGSVETYVVSDSGYRLPMEKIKAPSPLAAPFLFADNNKFPVDVVAMEDVSVIFIPKSSVERQMMSCAGFLRGFLNFNANQIAKLSERMKIFAQKGLKGKLSYYIMLQEKAGAFQLGRTLNDLAEYIGVERPSLSRALGEMQKDGIIEKKGAGWIITDYNRLKAMV